MIIDIYRYLSLYNLFFSFSCCLFSQERKIHLMNFLLLSSLLFLLSIFLASPLLPASPDFPNHTSRQVYSVINRSQRRRRRQRQNIQKNVHAFTSFLSKFASSTNRRIENQQSITSLKQELYTLIEGTDKGALSGKEERLKIIQVMQELESKNPTPNPGSSSFASGDWDMIWTTEDEIHGFRKGILGEVCQSVYQVTNNEDLLLENRIDYTGNTYLQIISKLSPESPEQELKRQEKEEKKKFDESKSNTELGKRVYFSWTQAKLQYGWLKIPFPNFVQNAWYENIFVDKDIRLVRDVRGNYLLIKRR